MASAEAAANEAAGSAVCEAPKAPADVPVENPAGADAGLGMWICSYCTYHNAGIADVKFCDACEKPRSGVPDSPDSAVTAPGGESKDVKHCVPWSCGQCTFWNEVGGKICAMCQIGRHDGTAGGPSEVPGGETSNNSNKTAECQSCTINQTCDVCKGTSQVGGDSVVPNANTNVNQAEVAAGGASVQAMPLEAEVDKQQQLGLADGEGPQKQEQPSAEPVKWSCQLCTFENEEPNVRCTLCTSPRPAEGSNSEQVSAENMCSLCGLIKPFGQPWKGGLCAQCRPAVIEEQPMEVAINPTSTAPSWSAPEPGPCGVCHEQVPGVLLQSVDACDHRACCACVAAVLLPRMEQAPCPTTASPNDVQALIRCWEPGCPRLLSSSALSCSLPGPSFVALSSWLVRVLTTLYSRYGEAAALNTAAPQEGQGPEFTCLADGCPANQQPTAYIPDNGGDPLWAGCPSCPYVTCLGCGAVAGLALASQYRDHAHACPLAPTFTVFHALLALEAAFQGSDTPTTEGREDEGHAHKKQKTEAQHKRSVWAKGTGFGGGAHDAYDEGAGGGDSDEDEEEWGQDEEEDEDDAYEEDEDDDADMGVAHMMGEQIIQEQHSMDDVMKDAHEGGAGEETAKDGPHPIVAPGSQQATAATAAELLTGMFLPTNTPPLPDVPAKTASGVPNGAPAVTDCDPSLALSAQEDTASVKGAMPMIVEGSPAGGASLPHPTPVSHALAPLEGVPFASVLPPPALPAPVTGASLPPLSGLVPPAALFAPPPPSGVDKRKGRKDKEEAREEKLRERERQADLRMTHAAEALTDALRGDDFAPQPNAGTAALLRASWASRVLFSVLHRCSLLDMGHNPVREQLYLALLHLVRALGGHPDIITLSLADQDQDSDCDTPTVAEGEGAQTGDEQRKRGRGLLGAALWRLSRALSRKGRTTENAGAEANGGVADGSAPSSDGEGQCGIPVDPALKDQRIVMGAGRSVLSALADLNREARIVAGGLKHGLVEGENEGECGVGVVGLVLEVGDCYDQLTRRAAMWERQRKAEEQAREERAALRTTAKESEERPGADAEEMPREAVSGEETVATTEVADDEMDVAAMPGGEDVQVKEMGAAAKGTEKGGVGIDPETSRRPLKERVMQGLKGMLISKKGKEAEVPSDEQAESVAVTADLDRRIRAYKAALKPLQFQEMGLRGEDGQYEHNYRGEVAAEYSEYSGSGAHSAKRQLRMLREIASLATTLPLEWESSVHIRVDDSRMDLLKALIIGPHDTPYSNGIWLFDVLLPRDYPERPPRVKFLTTGGGTVRFNPNLYDCGKVCLSLLGTWSGPSWRPGHSTLLQVLISLQSLVFVSEPYYNEPGYEARQSRAESEAYNQAVRLNAMKHAILGPLKTPPRAFQDVIQQHFTFKKAEVIRQVDEWAGLADSTHKEQAEQVGAQIKEELEKLGERDTRDGALECE